MLGGRIPARGPEAADVSPASRPDVNLYVNVNFYSIEPLPGFHLCQVFAFVTFYSFWLLFNALEVQ